MTADDGGHDLVIPEAIRSLLQSRAQYMEWLAKLDSLGASYSAEVADRVRADYRVRLTAVEGELVGHREELEQSLSGRKRQQEELERRHLSCATELEEVELRHQVGEFDENEWSERKQVHEAQLAEIAGALSIEREAVAELGAVLLQVTAPSEAADVMRVVQADPVPADEGPTYEEAELEPILDVPTADPDEEAADLAEPEIVEDSGREPETVAEVLEDLAIEFSESSDVELAEKLEEYAEQPDATEDAEAVEPERAGSGVAGSGGDQFLDELEFLESLSLDDPDSFDAVSRMLEEEGEAPPEEERSDQGGAG